MKQITKLIVNLGWIEFGIGLIGVVYFTIKALTEHGWAAELRMMFIFIALLYSILIFPGIKLLNLKPIGRKLTLFLSPLFALLVMGLIREVFVWKSLFGPGFGIIIDRLYIMVLIFIFLFLVVSLNMPKIKEQFK